jgi:hypothetical protein
MPRTAIAFHQRVAFSVNAVVKFSTGPPRGDLRAVAVRAKRNPKPCGECANAWGPGGHSQRGTKNTHPANSETFVAATLHDVLKLTLRSRGHGA